jgi:acyl dehydratase
MKAASLSKTFKMDKMIAYSGPGNLHSSDEAAQKAGLPEAIVQGGFLVACLTELVIRELGEPYFSRGSIAVNLLKPVTAGTTVTCYLSHEDDAFDQDDERFVVYKIWMENEDGALCAAGAASIPKDKENFVEPRVEGESLKEVE